MLAMAHPGLLLSITLQRVSFHSLIPKRAYPMTTIIHISGLITEPTSLPSPASDCSYEVCLRVQLLTCWLGFSPVGLSRTRFGITHWVTITNFMGFLPIPRSRIYLGTRNDLLGSQTEDNQQLWEITIDVFPV